jgi:ATP-dependent protease ClpP protease subunit
VSEWRDCLDFDAERYARIFEESTDGAGTKADIRCNLTGNARIFDADQALEAGIIHKVVQARLPEAGATSHWWN